MNLGLETTNSRPHASMTTVRPGGAGLDGLRRFEERRSSWGPTSGPPRAKNPPPLRNGPRSNRGEPRGDFGTGNPETRSSRGLARTLSRTYGSSPGRVEEGLLGNPPRNESNPSRPKGASEGASENAENAAARPTRLALNKRADELAPANVRSRRPLSRGSEAGCGVRTRAGEGDPPARGGAGGGVRSRAGDGDFLRLVADGSRSFGIVNPPPRDARASSGDDSGWSSSSEGAAFPRALGGFSDAAPTTGNASSDADPDAETPPRSPP